MLHTRARLPLINRRYIATRTCPGVRGQDHELVDWDQHTALIVERFDRVPREGALGRRHYISAASLVSATPQSMYFDWLPNRTKFSWSDLLDVTSAVSDSSSRARVEMYSRLALNAAIGNTDDHLKNFGFLRVDEQPMIYEVAPVFDVSPQPGTDHYLHCSSLERRYTLSQVTGLSRELKVSQAAASEVRDRIMSVLEHRHDFFDRACMTRIQVEAADAWIRRGSPDLARR